MINGSMTLRVAMVVLLAACGSLAGQRPVADLVADLTGPNLKARATARQLLPKAGEAAVSEVMPLLTHQDPMIAASAYQILLEIGYQAGAPGADEGAPRRVSDALIVLVDPKRTEPERIIGLRLLERLVPEGYDVAPIAAMLGEEPKLAEKARTALQRINTTQARAALREALKTAPPEFSCAILNALGEMRDAASLETIELLARSYDPAVRVAAARALAWTGDPAYMPLMRLVIKLAGTDTRSDAWDAALRLIQTMETNGGNWQIVRSAYLSMLREGKGVVQDAALAGLGRIGDGTCVRPVMQALTLSKPPTRFVALHALKEMQGVDVARALVDAYASLPAVGKRMMVGVLATKRVPEVLPTLIEAAESDHESLRIRGLAALGEVGLAGGLGTLKKTAATGATEEKRVAREALLTLADTLHERHHGDQAGAAYAAALAVCYEDEHRTRALVGIAAHPVPQAAEPLMKLDVSSNPQLATPALVAVAGRLAKDKKPDQAMAMYEKIGKAGLSADQMRSLVEQMRAAGMELDLGAALGVVTSWWLVGPFPFDDRDKAWREDPFDPASVDLKAAYEVGDTQIGWKHETVTNAGGVVNLEASIARQDHCLAYAYTEIETASATDAVLLIGSDDGNKVWINGQVVFDHLTDRGMTVDQDRAEVKLDKGVNRILVKISQNNGGWAFCFRIVTPDGEPLKFKQLDVKP